MNKNSYYEDIRFFFKSKITLEHLPLQPCPPILIQPRSLCIHAVHPFINFQVVAPTSKYKVSF